MRTTGGHVIGSLCGKRQLAAGAIVAATAAIVAGAVAGCISGPVLRGYPEYPFQTFVAPGEADSVFFDLQPLLVRQGFPLDYTRLDSHLIATRQSDVEEIPIFLSVIVGEEQQGVSSRVWVAGYQATPSGPLRVNPDDEALWGRVRQVAIDLSVDLGGTTPTGPGVEGGAPAASAGAKTESGD